MNSVVLLSSKNSVVLEDTHNSSKINYVISNSANASVIHIAFDKGIAWSIFQYNEKSESIDSYYENLISHIGNPNYVVLQEWHLDLNNYFCDFYGVKLISLTKKQLLTEKLNYL